MVIYIIIFIFLILLFSIFFGAFGGVVWFPTKKEDYDRIAELAQLKPGIFFYDLGSGTADMLFYLSKKYNINCVGIEISPLLYLYSKIRSLFNEKVKIYYGNLFRYNLARADVVYAFLHPDLYDELKAKLNDDLKDSSRIIIAAWPFKKLIPISTNQKEHWFTYYLYKKPL